MPAHRMPVRSIGRPPRSFGSSNFGSVLTSRPGPMGLPRKPRAVTVQVGACLLQNRIGRHGSLVIKQACNNCICTPGGLDSYSAPAGEAEYEQEQNSAEEHVRWFNGPHPPRLRCRRHR